MQSLTPPSSFLTGSSNQYASILVGGLPSCVVRFLEEATARGGTMANRLADETSPYLLQHKDNPVDWFPWGEEALERAREEDKPILLSVGYSACHWCHVMERESFEDEETARMMNEHFVSIKVDREERPDIDSIYMSAVQALTKHGGWPMTVFMTPTAPRSTAVPTSHPSRPAACPPSSNSS